MSVIGQPSDYSEMFKRTFLCTLCLGVLCTLALAWVSPAARTVLDSWTTTIDVGPIKNVKLLYAIIPLGLAGLMRAFAFHDRVSDLFNIRQHFDVEHILLPLARHLNVKLTTARIADIRDRRKRLMSQVFYKYASSTKPVIDPHYIRTALDRWGWFWVCMEAVFVLIVYAIAAMIFASFALAVVLLAGSAGALAIGVMFWPKMISIAEQEVSEILSDTQRRTEIEEHFNALPS